MRADPASAGSPAGPMQAVLFDMDGLLLDTETLWGRAERHTMDWLGHPIWTEADQAAMVGGPLLRVADHMIALSGSTVAADAVVEHLVDEVIRLVGDSARYRPGARELLLDLESHGVPCALVSNSPRRLVDAGLAAVGSEHFRTTVAVDEVARAKPAPDPYLQACRALGVDPAWTVVLEDSPVGVAAAEAAGCVVVAVPFAVPIDQARRRHVVPTLEHLDTRRLAALVAATPS